jgi:AraC family transcriptional regulator, activator of mtrCDE
VRSSCLALTIAENGGTGERLDMLCGRFVVFLTHERLLRNYLPSRLLVSAAERSTATAQPGTGAQLAAATLMRMESASADLGRHAMLKALSTAMFALTLRLASESDQAPAGLLALAGYPRLTPALAALSTNRHVLGRHPTWRGYATVARRSCVIPKKRWGHPRTI